MDLKLNGKRALVTGSSSGIGAGIAHVLAAEGATLIIHGRDRGRAEAVAAAVRSKGATAHVVVGSLDTDAGVAAVVKAAMEAAGGVDILVNNAGGSGVDGNPLWFEVPPEQWMSTYSENVVSAVRLSHAFVPGMKAQGWGRIINISSASGFQPNPFIPHYGASKAALTNLTVGLSKALSHTGITVNTVSPGAILTPGLEVWIRGLAEQMNWGTDWDTIEQRYTREFSPLPVSRLGRVEDIGNMVAMLSSDCSSYVTGADVRVDGGHSAAIN